MNIVINYALLSDDDIYLEETRYTNNNNLPAVSVTLVSDDLVTVIKEVSKQEANQARNRSGFPDVTSVSDDQ